MNTKALLGILSVLCLASACTGSLPEGESGSVAMMPFFDQEQGIQGVTPLEGWSDQAALLQQSFPGTKDELVAVIAEQTDLVTLPRPIGTYRGSAFTWDLFKIEGQIYEAGPGIFRMDLALAHDDARYYLIALITQPDEYTARAPMYESVLNHTLYALKPLE